MSNARSLANLHPSSAGLIEANDMAPGVIPTVVANIWVKFTGATGAILGSSSGVSVTRNSAGYYTITIPTQANNTYGVFVTVGTGVSLALTGIAHAANSTTLVSPTTTTFAVACWNTSSGTMADPNTVNVLVIR